MFSMNQWSSVAECIRCSQSNEAHYADAVEESCTKVIEVMLSAQKVGSIPDNT